MQTPIIEIAKDVWVAPCDVKLVYLDDEDRLHIHLRTPGVEDTEVTVLKERMSMTCEDLCETMVPFQQLGME